jgi:protein-S-isoprenylcysteine O-methyltransferase Ste14
MAGKPPLISPRQLVTFAAVIGLVAIADPQPVLYAIGCTLGLLGIAMRVWGCGHLRKNQDVVTSGPYAHVKNPLYVGTFLLALGGVLAAGSPVMPALLLWTALGPLFLVLWFGYYMPKKQRIEGNRLRKHFGSAYDEYDRAVPAFVPSLRRWPSSSRAPWHWPTFLSNHELGLDVLLVLLFVAMPFAQDWF